jgi:hypothetical protein
MSRRKPATTPYWLIQGFDGLSKIHEWKISARYISEDNVRFLLRTLTGRVGQTPDEIVGSYVNRRAPFSKDLLIVSRDGPCLRFTCGENPYFVAVYHRASR